MISRHIDGEINAIAAEWLGVGTVRGSGDHGRRYHVKGGVGAFKSMMDAIAEGWNMTLTADVPKVSRVAGLGIIKLASATGRPIFPVALATSRRERARQLGPLGHQPCRSAVAPPSSATRSACRPTPVAEALEQARSALEQALNAATERAYAIVDRLPAAVRSAAPQERLEIERRVSNNGIIAD